VSEKNTRDQEHRMSDSTTPQDGAAMPPASLGSGAKCRPIGAYVHTPTYDDLLAEIDRLRLTDAEREAVEWFAEVRKPLTRLTQSHNRERYKATLRVLLERLK
jgi:hypothetical protein